MMTTCCAIVGLVFLVLTNLAIIIAFATPYWMVTERINRGLWAYCDHQTCTWVFQESPYYLPGQDSGQCLHRGGTNSLFFFVLLGCSLLSACCCWCLFYGETLWLLLFWAPLSVCLPHVVSFNGGTLCSSLSFGFLSLVCMLLLVFVLGGTNSVLLCLLVFLCLSVCCCWCLFQRELSLLVCPLGVLCLSVCCCWCLFQRELSLLVCPLGVLCLSVCCCWCLFQGGYSLPTPVYWGPLFVCIMLLVLGGTLCSCLALWGPLFVCMLLFVLEGSKLCSCHLGSSVCLQPVVGGGVSLAEALCSCLSAGCSCCPPPPPTHTHTHIRTCIHKHTHAHTHLSCRQFTRRETEVGKQGQKKRWKNKPKPNATNSAEHVEAPPPSPSTYHHHNHHHHRYRHTTHTHSNVSCVFRTPHSVSPPVLIPRHLFAVRKRLVSLRVPDVHTRSCGIACATGAISETSRSLAADLVPKQSSLQTELEAQRTG